MEKIVVEIAGKFQKFDCDNQGKSLSIKIGRDLLNDVIIADSYIGGKQLIVSPSSHNDGFLKVTCLDKTNPVLINNKIISDREFELISGDEVTVGRTRITFYAEGHSVPVARTFSVSNWLHNHKLKPLISCLMLALLFGISFFMFYLSVHIEPEWGKLSVQAIVSVITAFIWASCWSLSGRFLTKQSYFFSHMFFSAFALGLLVLLGDIYSYFDYYFSSVLLGAVIDWVVSFVILGFLIGLNLTLVTHSSGAFKKGFISGACLLVLSSSMTYLMKDEYSNTPSHTVTIKPGFMPVPTPLSPEKYIERYDDLFAELASDD